jgi:hypothetical protein
MMSLSASPSTLPPAEPDSRSMVSLLSPPKTPPMTVAPFRVMVSAQPSPVTLAAEPDSKSIVSPSALRRKIAVRHAHDHLATKRAEFGHLRTSCLKDGLKHP